MEIKAKPDTLIGEILMEYPETQDVMIKFFGEEVACVFCPGQAFDTFEMIADLHGIEEDVVEEMLVEMNEMIAEIDAERPDQPVTPVAKAKLEQEGATDDKEQRKDSLPY